MSIARIALVVCSNRDLWSGIACLVLDVKWQWEFDRLGEIEGGVDGYEDLGMVVVWI